MSRAPFAALAVLLPSLAFGAPPAAPKKAAPPAPAAAFKALIGKVFSQETIAVMERNKDDGYRFAAFDAAAGYARVVGPFDGRDDFYRLAGTAGPVLLEVDYACGPDCTQKIAAYRFDAEGAPVHVAFKTLLSLPAFDELRRRLLTLCLDAGGDFDTERDARASDSRALPACPFAVLLNKTQVGRGMIYEVADDDGSGYALSVAKTRILPKAALVWKKGAFVGTDASLEPSVFLNGDKMRALF